MYARASLTGAEFIDTVEPTAEATQPTQGNLPWSSSCDRPIACVSSPATFHMPNVITENGLRLMASMMPEFQRATCSLETRTSDFSTFSQSSCRLSPEIQVLTADTSSLERKYASERSTRRIMCIVNDFRDNIMLRPLIVNAYVTKFANVN